MAGAAARFHALLYLVLVSGSAQPPAQVSDHMRRAQDALKDSRPADAMVEFNAVLALDPNNLDARANLGVLQYFAEQYREAIENLQAALAQQADMVKLRALLGMAEKRTGQDAPAVANLEL